MELFDLFSSQNNRDLGIGIVSDNAGRWIDRFLAMVAGLPAGWVGIAEKFQELMGDDRPHHPNAWGAATSMAVKRGLLVKTGQWFPMRKVTSNARMTPEYRKS